MSQVFEWSGVLHSPKKSCWVIVGYLEEIANPAIKTAVNFFEKKIMLLNFRIYIEDLNTGISILETFGQIEVWYSDTRFMAI